MQHNNIKSYKCNAGDPLETQGACGGGHLHHAKYINVIMYDVYYLYR